MVIIFCFVILPATLGEFNSNVIVEFAFVFSLNKHTSGSNIPIHRRTKHIPTNLSSRVEFLDTNFITYPLWDTAFDFCHFTSQISDVEAMYMAAKLLLED